MARVLFFGGLTDVVAAEIFSTNVSIRSGISVTGAGHGCFLLCAHEDEERDEKKKGIGEEPDNAKKNGETLADGASNLGPQQIIHAHGKERAHDAAAIHGEGRNEIEQNESNVNRSKLRGH